MSRAHMRGSLKNFQAFREYTLLMQEADDQLQADLSELLGPEQYTRWARSMQTLGQWRKEGRRLLDKTKPVVH